MRRLVFTDIAHAILGLLGIRPLDHVEVRHLVPKGLIALSAGFLGCQRILHGFGQSQLITHAAYSLGSGSGSF